MLNKTKGLPFLVFEGGIFRLQFGPPSQNRFSKKMSVLRRQNAQKSGNLVSESPPKSPPSWHPKNLSKKYFWQFGGPKSTSKMGPSWAIFYAPRWPKLRAPILAPRSIFHDLRRPSWDRFWGGFQKSDCRFFEHSTSTECSFFLKIGSGRGSKLGPSWGSKEQPFHKSEHSVDVERSLFSKTSILLSKSPHFWLFGMQIGAAWATPSWARFMPEWDRLQNPRMGPAPNF